MVVVKGKTIDNKTRCIHYHSALDIIAIKFKCCNTYYPCFQCHQESVNHTAQVWLKADFDNHAILCGNCMSEMTIQQYKTSNYTCPNCLALFNPKCVLHDHLYFEV